MRWISDNADLVAVAVLALALGTGMPRVTLSVNSFDFRELPELSSVMVSIRPLLEGAMCFAEVL